MSDGERTSRVGLVRSRWAGGRRSRAEAALVRLAASFLAEGGSVDVLAADDAQAGEVARRWDQLLPPGRRGAGRLRVVPAQQWAADDLRARLTVTGPAPPPRPRDVLLCPDVADPAGLQGWLRRVVTLSDADGAVVCWITLAEVMATYRTVRAAGGSGAGSASLATAIAWATTDTTDALLSTPFSDESLSRLDVACRRRFFAHCAALRAVTTVDELIGLWTRALRHAAPTRPPAVGDDAVRDALTGAWPDAGRDRLVSISDHLLRIERAGLVDTFLLSPPLGPGALLECHAADVAAYERAAVRLVRICQGGPV